MHELDAAAAFARVEEWLCGCSFRAADAAGVGNGGGRAIAGGGVAPGWRMKCRVIHDVWRRFGGGWRERGEVEVVVRHVEGR